ncbi:hypothetical protein AB9P05_14290 [Roseivirga sp. BDSF3-8]|uniref:hypothetical protein n=1 Tax=Roseivirga sp. BDSF3-8 TaxID=3241598 RepID=UPI00353182C4
MKPITFFIAVLALAGLTASGFISNNPTRTFTYRDEPVLTTIKVPSRFLGKYQGRNGGYLELKADGTGTYVYDYFVYPLEECVPGPISIEWGFMANEDGSVFRYDRQYGLSYPVILKAVSQKTSFQGCREEVIMDYILVRGNELSVSSSDDWVKHF